MIQLVEKRNHYKQSNQIDNRANLGVILPVIGYLSHWIIFLHSSDFNQLRVILPSVQTRSGFVENITGVEI